MVDDSLDISICKTRLAGQDDMVSLTKACRMGSSARGVGGKGWNTDTRCWANALAFFSRAPCRGSIWCSERKGRFRGVFQVLGGFT
jgi:hypothetical protein